MCCVAHCICVYACAPHLPPYPPFPIIFPYAAFICGPAASRLLRLQLMHEGRPHKCYKLD